MQLTSYINCYSLFATCTLKTLSTGINLSLFFAIGNHHVYCRDIKPENILLENKDPNNLNIKITDFGFACFYDPKEGLKEVLGSPLYMAPEIVKEETYDEKVDTWSVGVITYILLSGRPPFKGRSKAEMFKSIINDPLSFDNRVWTHISKDAKDFITKALIKDKS